MAFTAIVEASVINHKSTAFAIHYGRVVTLSHLTNSLETKVVVSGDEQVATSLSVTSAVVHRVVGINGTLTLGVNVWAVWILAPEHAHHITFCG